MSGPTRRVARALVSTIKPVEPGWDPPIEDEVIGKMERDMGRFSGVVRFGFVVMLWLLNLGGILVGRWPIPLTWQGSEGRQKQLTAFQHSRFPALRLAMRAIKTHIQIIIFCLPEVDERFGIDHQAWRRDRIAFRQRLVEADATRAELPKTPEALGSEGVTSPETYLGPSSGAQV